MDMTSNQRKTRSGYAQCFATSPSPLGMFLAAGGPHPGSLADLSSTDRACLIAAAGNLLRWTPELVLERLREWVPEAPELHETASIAAFAGAPALLGLPWTGQTEIPDTPVAPLVTAAEWSRLCHAARSRSQDPAVAGGPLTFELECCGFVYSCPWPVDDARCCARCRPLFARSDRPYAPQEYVIDDMIRQRVSEQLGQLAASSDPGLMSLAAYLAQAVQAGVLVAANRIEAALPALPPELQTGCVSMVQEMGRENRRTAGETRDRVTNLRRQVVQNFPEALAAARRGEGLAFLQALLTIGSSLVALERADDCPTADQLKARVHDIVDLIYSGQLSTRSVAAIIRSSRTLPAVESPDSAALRTVITLSRGPLLKLLDPKRAPLAGVLDEEPVTHFYLDLDAETFGRTFDDGIANCLLRYGDCRRIAAHLGCHPARVQQVFDRMRSPSEAVASPSPGPIGKRKPRNPELQAQPEAEQAGRARHREQLRSARAAVEHLAMLVTRFRQGRSLDFREARQFLDPGAPRFPDRAESPLTPRTTLHRLPPPTLETFDDQVHHPGTVTPSTGDRWWQQALQEVHFGAARVFCGPGDERAIREAKRYLYRLNQGLTGEMTAHNHAYRIRLTPGHRIVIEAQLLASELPEALDQSWQLPSGTARQYRDLFFNHGSSRELVDSGDWIRFVSLRDDDLGPLECYLKRTALLGAATLRAALGHLQRVHRMLVPLPGPPIPISDAEFLEAECRWVRHCHPVLSPALDSRFWKRVDEFRLLLLESASPRLRPRTAGARSRAQSRLSESRPDLFSHSALSTGSPAASDQDSGSPAVVAGLDEGEVGVETAWSPEPEDTIAGVEVLSARGRSP